MADEVVSALSVPTSHLLTKLKSMRSIVFGVALWVSYRKSVAFVYAIPEATYGTPISCSASKDSSAPTSRPRTSIRCNAYISMIHKQIFVSHSTPCVI